MLQVSSVRRKAEHVSVVPEVCNHDCHINLECLQANSVPSITTMTHQNT
jgi:hypothetical protein